ncbi:MAG: dipeptidase PepE [Candidatus Wallbacteria bacterium]|nr:dipeptidase PepE [Candidatus Wallbacteria bacterium]
MPRLLLISNSYQHGLGYLDHCEQELRALYGPAVRRVLFVGYAGSDLASYARGARERFGRMGYELDAVQDAEAPAEAVREAEAIFIGGGNTFRLLKALYEKGLVEAIRKRVLEGMPYGGASAGANVACVSIRTTNDMPIVQPPSFGALDLVPFNINPHYLDPDPSSTHRGETREQRIREFHEENWPPVVGLREGAMLRIEDSSMQLAGVNGARLFERGREPRELACGEPLDFLLQPGSLRSDRRS